MFGEVTTDCLKSDGNFSFCCVALSVLRSGSRERFCSLEIKSGILPVNLKTLAIRISDNRSNNFRKLLRMEGKL